MGSHAKKYSKKPIYNPRVVSLRPADIGGQKVIIKDAELLRLWRILNHKKPTDAGDGKT